MVLEGAFRSISCPPVRSTYSFGLTPFPNELPTHTEFGLDDAREHIYQDWCQSVANTDGLGNLEWVYGRDIRGTLVEICSSIVVRSEHQFTSDERRLCLRKHVYELDRPTTPYEADPKKDPRSGHDRALGYHQLTAADRFGRYLGFMDLRWLEKSGNRAKGSSPLALGVLAVPKRFLANPAAVVITGGYGPVFAGPTFPATVYSMCDPGTGGAGCVPACVIMGLGLLSDRQARMIGSHNITFLASDREDHRPATRVGRCVAAHPRYRPASYYAAGALRPERIHELLNRRDANGDPELRVTADLVTEHAPGGSDRFLTRLLEAHVDGRFPVIAFVDTDTWYEYEIKQGEPKATSDYLRGHAVLVAGYVRTGPSTDDITFLVHDPSGRPFVHRPRKKFLDAIRRYDSRRFPDGRTYLIPITDDRIRTPLRACVGWLQRPEGGQRVHALFDRHDLDARLADYLGASVTTDVRFHLLDRGANGQAVQKLLPRTVVNRKACLPEVERQIGGIPGERGRYWCVAGLTAGGLRHLWVFDAEAVEPSLRLILEVDEGTVTCLYPVATTDRWQSSDVPAGDRDRQAGTWDAIPRVLPELPKLKPLASPLPRVEVSVLTSCSTRRLREFITDTAFATGCTTFDLMTLRDIDFRDFLAVLEPQRPPASELEEAVANDDGRPANDDGRPANEMTALLGTRHNGVGVDENLAEWYSRQLTDADQALTASLGRPTQCKVAALATYLPWLAAIDYRLRQQAVNALTNAVLVACRLKKKGRMEHAVVETTCGTRHDPCWCPDCRRPGQARRCHVSWPTAKRRILLKSLEEVVAAVRGQYESVAIGHQFYIALEYEPGITYNLNSERAIEAIFHGIDDRPALRPHVGLNLDINHMRIDRIPAARLERFADRILHAHVSDCPEHLHTRDLPPGVATPGLTTHSPYLEYFRLLARRAASASGGRTALPYTGSCAIELEGVDDTDWVYSSVPMVRHMAEAARRWA